MNKQDNTLTAPYEDDVHPLVEEGLRRCMEVFEGRVCIMSNSAGTRYVHPSCEPLHVRASCGYSRTLLPRPVSIQQLMDSRSARKRASMGAFSRVSRYVHHSSKVPARDNRLNRERGFAWGLVRMYPL